MKPTSGLTLGTASFDKPFSIAVGGGFWKVVVWDRCHGHPCARFEPFLYFRMSIGKTKTTGPAVITGRQIHKVSGIIDIRDRPTVVDAVGMLIHKHPELGR